MGELLAYYQNGNYTVSLYRDGTKIKRTREDAFHAAFPDSIDLKITDRCDRGCPMCHEGSSPDGREGDLNAPFLSTLVRGTELAIGGGDPLSHPGLTALLERMRERGVICNLTVNEAHLLGAQEYLEELMRRRLIYGLGISVTAYEPTVVEFARAHSGVVLHLINGLFTDYGRLCDQNLKILILGYKKFGRGASYFSPTVQREMERTYALLPTLIGRFRCISFDNLALEQLDVRRLVSEEEYQRMYMGDDGEASMYIDLVRGQFAKSSVSAERLSLREDILSMFRALC